MTWLLLKLASFIGNAWLARLNALLDAVLKMVEFVFKHWRVFLPVAMLCISLLYVNGLQNKLADETTEKLAAIKALNDHLAENAEAAKLRAADNKRKATQGKLVAKNIEAKAKQEITKILLNERNQHAADKAVSDRDLRNARERLRLELVNLASARAGLPSDDENRLAGTDSDTAAVRRENEILRAGGAVCASDYNKCKAYVDSEQLRLGVEP